MISRRALLAGASGLVASPAFGFPVIDAPRPRRATDIAKRAGVWDSVKLALDAADANSYASGQLWNDLTANGYNFHRGAGSGSSTDDPTFNGTVGALTANEFWSVDGADFFTKATANDAFFNGLHKDNAEWSVALLCEDLNVSSSAGLFATRGGTTANLAQRGVSFIVNASNGLSLFIANGSGTDLGLSVNGNAGEVPTSGAVMVGLSFNEAVGANGGMFYVSSGYTETFTSTIDTPSGGAGSNPASIFATAANNPMPNGSKLRAVWVGDRAWSTQEFDNLWQLSQART